MQYAFAYAIQPRNGVTWTLQQEMTALSIFSLGCAHSFYEKGIKYEQCNV